MLLHPLQTVGYEIEDVVLELQIALLAGGRVPVHDIDVMAALEQELHQALAGRQIEDVGLVRGRHDEQDRDPINLLHHRLVVIEAQRAATVQQRLRSLPHGGVRRSEIAEALQIALDRAVDFDPHAIGHDVSDGAALDAAMA